MYKKSEQKVLREINIILYKNIKEYKWRDLSFLAKEFGVDA